jgi:hypothetical protein
VGLEQGDENTNILGGGGGGDGGGKIGTHNFIPAMMVSKEQGQMLRLCMTERAGEDYISVSVFHR